MLQIPWVLQNLLLYHVLSIAIMLVLRMKKGKRDLGVLVILVIGLLEELLEIQFAGMVVFFPADRHLDDCQVTENAWLNARVILKIFEQPKCLLELANFCHDENQDNGCLKVVGIVLEDALRVLGNKFERLLQER
jgi:hypothetical protein